MAMQAVTSPIAHHIHAKKVIDVPPSDLEQNDVDDATTKTTSRRAQLSLQCKMCFVLTSNKQCLHLGPDFRTLVRIRTFLGKLVRIRSGFCSKVRIFHKMKGRTHKMLFL